MPAIYLGIGSNLGDCKLNCHRSLQLIELSGHRIVKKSSLYRTKPVGLTSQEDFLNRVVELRTDSPPLELLADLQEIEREMGRRRTIRWGPRVIDLDILLYGDEVIDGPALKVPHPLMHKRGFVLIPLLEIAPEIFHASFEKPFSGLLADLDESADSVTRIG